MISIIALIVVVLIGLVGCSIMSGQGKTQKANEPKKGITAKNVVEAPVKAIPKPNEPVAANKHVISPEPGHDYSIVIDKGRFTLYLMDSGKEINHFGVALGLNPGQKHKAGDMTTPTGDFTVEEIDDASYWKHDFGDGKGEIAGAYGPYFISLITGWDGIGIHGTHDPASIGHRVSEGCIRLNNKDLLIVEKFVKPGTKVRIQE
jgi:lipoprotein-anchoring transpeptidase ErfK/SrfK